MDRREETLYLALVSVPCPERPQSAHMVAENIFIENYVRQLGVFPDRRLHIGHGWMGSTQEAL